MSGEQPVVAFGEIMLRLAAPGSSRLLQQPSLEAVFGGAEFNVLASLARLGLPAEYVTVLPDNPLGTAALEEIRRHGVGTRHLRRHDARMGLYFIEAGADSRAGRIVYDRADSAFSRLDPGWFDWRAILSNARWLHLTGISAAVGTQPCTALAQAARVARQLNVPVSLDVNMRPSLWATTGRKPLESLRAVLEQATLIFAGTGDWSACLDEPQPDTAADLAAPAFLERMLATYPQAQAVVSGMRRSHNAGDHDLSALAAVRGAAQFQARTVRVRQVVDRVGAGDAMVAGCLYSRLNGAPWPQALDFGVMAGALKHSVPGDVSRIAREEIEAALAGQDAGRLLR